jgi:hypothetical protein
MAAGASLDRTDAQRSTVRAMDGTLHDELDDLVQDEPSGTSMPKGPCATKSSTPDVIA